MIGFTVAIWTAFLLVVVARSKRRSAPLAERSERGARTVTAQYGVFFAALSASLVVEAFHHVEALHPLRLCAPTSDVRCLAHPSARTPLQVAGALLLALSFGAYLMGVGALARDYYPLVGVKRDQGITTHGPYAYVRHPLYAAQAAMMCATAMVFQSVCFAALPLAFYFFYRTAREEERLLTRHFPDYASYAGRTKMFVPWVF
jgi:protein-S-isoprenylcysteine O-methyltransferase Ste14